MLREREIRAYLKSHHAPGLISQISPSYDPQTTILSLHLAIDLHKLRRQNGLLCQFVIGNYHKFTQLVEETAL